MSEAEPEISNLIEEEEGRKQFQSFFIEYEEVKKLIEALKEQNDSEQIDKIVTEFVKIVCEFVIDHR